VAEGRTVTCSRCGDEGPGLARPPLSGDVGRQVYEQVCQTCWSEWFEQQITVINHYGLTPAVPEDRRQLYEVMREFLALKNE